MDQNISEKDCPKKKSVFIVETPVCMLPEILKSFYRRLHAIFPPVQVVI
jgi:hypothetical protein